MKKLLAKIFLITVCLVSVFALSSCKDGTTVDKNTSINGNGLSFSLNEDEDTYSITGFPFFDFVNEDFKRIIVPSEHNGKPVTRVIDFFQTGYYPGAWDDTYNDVLEYVEIPDTIEYIEPFRINACSALKEIVVDDDNAYYKTVDGNLYNKDGTELICYAKAKEDTTFVIPDGVITIFEVAFGYDTSDYEIEGGYFASIYAENLETIVIPASVTNIESGAFAFCPNLTSIVVDDENENYKSIDGNLYKINEDETLTLIQYLGRKKEAVFTVPENVTVISDKAFLDCTGLASIAIGDSVTSIGSSAFSGCSSLTSVTIPNSVTSIGSSAFSGCSSLTSVTIPNSVTSIGSSAFSGCSSLKSVTIPNSVTSIGDGAFRSCNLLTSVTISDSVTNIGEEAFLYCSSLTDVYYTGSEEEWVKISIGLDNGYLTTATIHYNYEEN